MTTDLTLEVLKSIRDEIKQTRCDLQAEIKQTREELRAELKITNQRLGTVETRMAESEIRLGTAVLDLATTLNEVRTLLKNDLELRPRVEQCEKDIAQLKQRLPDA
jgi:chromosome segregation ATPase